MVFRYFSFLARKSRRFRQYKRHMDVLRDRMDVRNVIVYEGYSMAVINTLLEPYQIKLLTYLSQSKFDKSQTAYSIPIDDATSKLIHNLSLEEGETESLERKAN